MRSFSIHKLLYQLLVIGLCCLTLKTYFAQNNAEQTALEEKFDWYYKFEFIGNMFVMIVSLLSFILYKKIFPTFVSVCYVTLVLLVIITSLPEIADVFKKPSFFFTIRGIGNFLNFGLIFFAANTMYFKKILKLFYLICITFIIAGLINLSKVGMGAAREQFLFAIGSYAVNLIWIFPFFFLQDESDKKLNILNTVIFFIIFIFVFATGARTYLIIYALYLIVKFKVQLQSKNALVVIIGTLLLGTGIYFAIINSDLKSTLGDAFTVLSERANTDTRSGQIREFLRQWEPEYFLQGVGPFKKWYWTNVEDFYYFLDNQFLLMGWWAGLPALFVYIYLLVRTFFHKPEIKMFEKVNGIRMMLGLWILACMGFAIYVTISSSLYYFFLELLMGYHLCKFSMLKNPDFEEIT